MGRSSCCCRERFVESVFQSRLGGALRSPLLMDGGGWVWEGGWKGGSGLCQAPGQKEMHAGKLVPLEGEKGHAESPAQGHVRENPSKPGFLKDRAPLYTMAGPHHTGELSTPRVILGISASVIFMCLFLFTKHLPKHHGRFAYPFCPGSCSQCPQPLWTSLMIPKGNGGGDCQDYDSGTDHERSRTCFGDLL